MLNDPLFLIATGSVLAVLVILMLGIGNFAKGGEDSAKRSNMFMRYRIYAQAIAIVVILGFVYLRSKGH